MYGNITSFGVVMADHLRPADSGDHLPHQTQ